MIVTIDGPAGAGKSSAARELARRLGFEFLDTGAMYRVVTLAALRARCDFSDETSTQHLLNQIKIDMPPGKVLLNGEDVTEAIRKPEVTEASGKAASCPAVRTFLVQLQRQFAQGRNIVTEGRDQGTIVFPQAECKFFLVADPMERARRRYQELLSRGENISLEEVLKAQQDRDDRDAKRDIAPMIAAPDAKVVDSSHLTLDEVVEHLEQEVRTCMHA